MSNKIKYQTLLILKCTSVPYNIILLPQVNILINFLIWSNIIYNLIKNGFTSKSLFENKTPSFLFLYSGPSKISCYTVAIFM